MTIVIVDDDPCNLDLLEAVLEPLGAKLARFEDPLEALRAIEGLQPVLVITDYLMPALQGLELVARLRATPAVADIPVLMLTGTDEAAMRVAAFDVGVTDFATRPFDPTELLARARALSRLGAAQAEMKRQASLLAGEVRQATATLAVRQREHERLNQQLRAAEHFEGIAELASGMAHDINNLLTVISGGAEAIGDMFREDDAVARETQAILEAVERGASLTRQVLAYSRRQALRPSVFDAAREVERNRLILAHAAGNAGTLALELTQAAAPVWADQTQFLTALINLIANARDASRRDPRIVVRVDVPPSVSDDGRAGGPAPTVLVEVADNGAGMTSEVASRAFDPFFTTKPRGEGTGLGLSMVHGFVHQSGGTLRLLSTRGVGTRVRLFFPLATSTAAAEAAAPPPPPPAPPRRTVTPRVLVVDDDDAVRRMLARMLELRGLLVDTAPHAMAAIQRLRNQRFDAVLSDVLMPGDLDGLDLARWARQRGLPVLLVSGFVGGELPRDLLADAAVRLLRKPVDSAQLAQELRSLIQAGDAGEGEDGTEG
jgi:signal transduction histidine kinase